MPKVIIVADVDEVELRNVMEDHESSLPELITEVINSSFWDDIQSRYMKTTDVIVTDKDVNINV